jgi:probable H4MPT-linked C1 transfer pathway protein
MPRQPDAPRPSVGWDIGGAHVKACLLEGGAVRDIAQWACPLWQGLSHLDAALASARSRWPQAWDDARTRHAVTMTGEMVDLFADREDGVRRLAARLAESLGPSVRMYAGDAAWVPAHRVGEAWRDIASANWRATAQWLAPQVDEALLVDIGSTTTDIVPLARGRVVAAGANDFERLACGELVYQGVVRTPLCVLAQRVPFEGRTVGVMNEFFATVADVYRLSGELDPEYDQQSTADAAPKDLAATRQRLARMVGRDARDATAAQWRDLALAWRELQASAIAEALDRVAGAVSLAPAAPVVAAGCGAFLAAEAAARTGRPCSGYARHVPLPADSTLAGWAQVCAPAVAVALLCEREV